MCDAPGPIIDSSQITHTHLSAGANVIVVTSPELLAAAGTSEKGGYGASQRVSIVSTPDGVKIVSARSKPYLV